MKYTYASRQRGSIPLRCKAVCLFVREANDSSLTEFAIRLVRKVAWKRAITEVVVILARLAERVDLRTRLVTALPLDEVLRRPTGITCILLVTRITQVDRCLLIASHNVRRTRSAILLAGGLHPLGTEVTYTEHLFMQWVVRPSGRTDQETAFAEIPIDWFVVGIPETRITH